MEIFQFSDVRRSTLADIQKFYQLVAGSIRTDVRIIFLDIKAMKHKFIFIIWVMFQIGLDGAYARTNKVKYTQHLIEELQDALFRFKIDVDRFPTPVEGLKSLVVKPEGLKNWHGPYIKSKYVRRDSWGNNFIYKSSEIPSSKNYLLYSTGENGIDEQGLGDDVLLNKSMRSDILEIK